MDRLEAMRLFARVVELGSFSAAAREFGTSQPTVSRRLAALEEHLGVRLLNRTTRHVTTTEAGEAYYERVVGALDAVSDAEAAALDVQGSLRGPLRVGASVAFGLKQVVPRIEPFLQAHPNVELHLALQDSFLDLVQAGLDVAIRIAPQLNQHSLRATTLAASPRVLVATPEYWSRRGRPSHPDDLLDHDCLVFTQLQTRARWFFAPQGAGREVSVGVEGRFSSSNSVAVAEAAAAGLGLSVLPTWMIAEELATGRLEVAMSEWVPRPRTIYAVYPETRRVSRRVRALIDFLREVYQGGRWTPSE